MLLVLMAYKRPCFAAQITCQWQTQPLPAKGHPLLVLRDSASH